MRFYDGQLKQGVRDQHVLLHTDTWLGQEAAKIVQQWLKVQDIPVELKTFEYLRTDSMLHFRRALADIARWCAEGLPKSGYNIIFNLTGGFKSIQGFMQTLGTFYTDESIYIFERSEELLRIPRLPVRFDAIQDVKKYLPELRRLSLGIGLSEDEVPDLYVLDIDGECCLSDWGQLVWNESKKEAYNDKLLDPITDTYHFSDKFRNAIQALSSERICIINERMDELAAYFENKEFNLKSLSFKKLKGNPYPPCTHELYAWSKQDAKRIFGYYDADDTKVFIIDRLEKHL